MKNKTGNSSFLKKYNKSSILDLIRQRGSISRAGLSDETGLSATAIGMITSELLLEDYIHETGIGKSSGGRRPVMLELKPRTYFSIGVDVDVEGITSVLIDTTGTKIDQAFVAMKKKLEPAIVSQLINEAVENLVKQNRVSLQRLLGVGISVPGIVDSASHRVVLAPNIGWRNVDLAAELSNSSILSDMPVFVENEAMASSICENWIGVCQGLRDFVCINIKSGIGAGIFTGGKLYRGAGGSAGEVGHIAVDENGPLCGCGNYGCLETLASTHSIVDRARKLVRQGVVSSLNNIHNVDEIELAHVIDAALCDDEAARSIFQDAARYIGIAVSSLVNTLNPQMIVLGKEFTRFSELQMDTIKGVVSRRALSSPASQVNLVASSFGQDSSALGAAIIPCKVLFGK